MNLRHVSFVLMLVATACSPSARRISASSQMKEARPVPYDEAGQELIRDVTRAAEGAGARPAVLLGYGAGTPGDRIESLVHIPPETCALFVARGTSEVEDLDLHIYSDDGSQLGIDESPDDVPTLLLCPEEEIRLFVSARVAQGEGLVALAVQTVAQDRADDVAKAVGARNFSGEIATIEEPWPGLQEAIDERRAMLGGRFLDQRRVALPVDSRVPTHITVDVPAERCLDVLVLPSGDVSGLQLMGLDVDGRIFARADSSGHKRTLLLCSTQEGISVTLRLRPYAGRGVAVAATSMSRGPLASLEPAPEITVALVSGVRHPADRDKLPRAQWTKASSIQRGQLVSFDLKLEGCSRLDLIADESLLDFEARLYDNSGKLLGETTGRSGAPLFACSDAPARLDVEARGRSGELRVERRSAAAPSPKLTQFPLAASRLLARAHSFGKTSMPEDIGKVSSLPVDSTSLKRIPLSVPAAHCQTIFFGGDHGAWGLRARIVDRKTGLTLDHGIGRGSLELHACAPTGGTLKADVELQTTSGETVALWAARQERIPAD